EYLKKKIAARTSAMPAMAENSLTPTSCSQSNPAHGATQVGRADGAGGRSGTSAVGRGGAITGGSAPGGAAGGRGGAAAAGRSRGGSGTTGFDAGAWTGGVTRGGGCSVAAARSVC